MREKTPRKFSTTSGTRDVLPPESTRLLDTQAKVLERFRLHGFREVITPALEYSEVIEEPKLHDSAFKLFDPDNQMLLLRPEVTTPVARLVAQRLRNTPPPYKPSHSLSVQRRPGVGRGPRGRPPPGRASWPSACATARPRTSSPAASPSTAARAWAAARARSSARPGSRPSARRAPGGRRGA